MMIESATVSAGGLWELLAVNPFIGPLFEPITYSFSPLMTVNATASRAGAQYCVRMRAGLVLALWNLADVVLAEPAVLRDVGRPRGELPGDRARTPFIRDMGFLFEEPVVPPPSALVGRQPRDEARRAAARTLRTAMIDVALMHEIAHIVAGHVDFLCDQGNLALDEIPSEELALTGEARSLGSRRVRRAMETHADTTAIELLCWLSGVARTRCPAYRGLSAWAFGRMTCFAAMLLFTLIHELDASGAGDHPSGAARFLSVMTPDRLPIARRWPRWRFTRGWRAGMREYFRAVNAGILRVGFAEALTSKLDAVIREHHRVVDDWTAISSQVLAHDRWGPRMGTVLPGLIGRVRDANAG